MAAPMRRPAPVTSATLPLSVMTAPRSAESRGNVSPRCRFWTFSGAWRTIISLPYVFDSNGLNQYCRQEPAQW